jgi:hypothetical protein
VLCSAPSAPLTVTLPPLLGGSPAVGLGGASTAVTLTGLHVTTPRPGELVASWTAPPGTAAVWSSVTVTGPLSHGRTSWSFITLGPKATITGLAPGKSYTISIAVQAGGQTSAGSITGRPYGTWTLSHIAVHPATSTTPRLLTMAVTANVGAPTPRPTLQLWKGHRWVTISRFLYNPRHHTWSALLRSASGRTRIVIAAAPSYPQVTRSLTIPRAN